MGTSALADVVWTAVLACLLPPPGVALQFQSNCTDDVAQRALLVTMITPGGSLPLDLMLAHQKRLLTGCGSKAGALKATVLVNWDHWMNLPLPQPQELQLIQSSGAAGVKLVDYARVDDPAFLGRFFKVAGPSRFTVRNLSEARDDASKQDGVKIASNFLGMLHFLQECLASPGPVELCVYLDPDIFLYRSRLGLIELASAAFRRGPSFVALQPPTVCHWAGLDDGASSSPAADSCWTIGNESVKGAEFQSHPLLSQRYMFVNRSRLMGALPLEITPDKFYSNFEKVFSRALRPRNMAGWLACRGQAFAIHPCGSFRCRAMHIKEHVSAMAAVASETTVRGEAYSTRGHSFDVAVRTGTNLLADRVEAGRFDPVAVNSCQDMNTSWARIESGLAW